MKLLRQLARQAIDRLQHHPRRDTELIGDPGAAWCVCTSLPARVSVPVLFSGGAGKNISFERDFAQRFGARVFLYDPSPTGRKTVERHPPIEGLTFLPLALAREVGTVRMSKPTNSGEGSWTLSGEGADEGDQFESTSLLHEITSRDLTKVDVVKLDIEGFEYEVLEELLESSVQIDQILVELHDFFPHIPKSRSGGLRRLLKHKGYACFFKRRFDFSFIRQDALPA